jgi:hypothetical protein
MEHAEEADFGAEMAGIAGDFEQRFRTGPEQEIVDDLLVLQGQRGEPTRKGENDMDVGGGQEFAAARSQPTVASLGLTLGAVSIPAGNGEISITCHGLNRYAVDEADIPIKTRQSASTSPSHMSLFT